MSGVYRTVGFFNNIFIITDVFLSENNRADVTKVNNEMFAGVDPSVTCLAGRRE